MRDAREVIRLKSSSVSTHEIARRLGLGRSTVRETLKRAETAGLAWPLPEDMNDEALGAALYANRRSKRGHRRIAEPDWASVHRELKRKHVTLLILNSARRGRRAGVRPGAFEIGAEREELLPFRLAKRGGHRAIIAAMSPSIRAMASKVSFHRRSNSPATSRLAGSTASYWRRA